MCYTPVLVEMIAAGVLTATVGCARCCDAERLARPARTPTLASTTDS